MALRGHRDNVRDLRISCNAQRLVSASSDKCVRVWDLRAPGRCVAGLRVHDDAAWALAAADENLDMVYSGGRDGKVLTCYHILFMFLFCWC
jgi:WD40 repeat protein